MVVFNKKVNGTVQLKKIAIKLLNLIRLKSFIAIYIVYLGLLNCAQNSPLSDIVLNDPSLFKVEAQIEKDIYKNGAINWSIVVNLKDKNGSYIEIKNGGISINGINMITDYLLGTNAPYYYLPSAMLSIVPDSLYTITIVLSNGTKYLAKVKTPQKDLYAFYIAAQHKYSDSLTVSWQDTVTDSDLEIYTQKHFDHDTINATSNFPIVSPVLGQYTFPPSFFKSGSTNLLKSVDFQLISIKHGDVDGSFRSDSYIYYVINIYRSTIITQ
ncbi:MAG: hypothetical protein PHW12_04510 [Smithella sp.]|nr:hypothetical protein [Smithella sp.]